MAYYIGRSAVLQLAAVLGMIALLLGPIVIYEQEESGIKYSVFLKSFNSNQEKIWGSIRIDIRNNNDFDVAARNIKVKISNPDTGELIYELFHAGGTIKPGEKFSESFGFDVNIDSIPETEIIVSLSAYVKWGSEPGSWVEHEFPLSIEY